MRNANDSYAHYNGTECYYKHPFSSFVYTDGVKALAMDCEAYWLIDLVISYQLAPKVRAEVFQVVATDGNEAVIARQQVPYSDFPYDGCTLWLVDGVLMLPSEY